MQDRFKFRIAVFERYNTDKWTFIKFIKNSDKFGVSTNGNVIQENVNSLIIHLPRKKTPENVYRTMEAMQCTGRRDKNDTLIYENDLIKNLDNRIFRVVWAEDAACFLVENIKNKMKQGIYSLISLDNRLEVIGNIYENADLLGAEE